MSHYSQRVEQHFISEEHPFYKWAIAECGRAASLWNRTNYIYRAAIDGKHELIPEYADLIRDGKYLMAYDMISRMRKLNEESYRNTLKDNEAAQTVIMVDQAWKGWARSIASWKENPNKFKSIPKPPWYKKKADKGGTCPLVFTYQDAKLKKDGKIFIKRDFCLPIKTKVTKLQQVRIVPVIGGVNIEVIYNKEISDKQLDETRTLGIDLGINNLMAITSNVKAQSMLVNGRSLKSINQYYNKKVAKIKPQLAHQKLKSSKRLRRLVRKRNNKIKDYMHKASRRVVDFAINNNIGTIIVGHNIGWKNEANIGSKNNQNFVSIPHTLLISMLKYKIEEAGGRLIEINESHTSKCSFLDDEKICHHDKYIGKRVKRGLFKTAKNQYINADINGSLNIVKRGMGASFTPDKSVFNPITIDVEMKSLSGNIRDRGTGLVPDSSNRIEVKSMCSILDTNV